MNPANRLLSPVAIIKSIYGIKMNQRDVLKNKKPARL